MAGIIFWVSLVAGIYNLIVACSRDLISDTARAYYKDHESDYRKAVNKSIRRQFMWAGIFILIAFFSGRICL